MEKHTIFEDVFMGSTDLWLEARSFLSSALCLCFALPSSLGCLIVTTTASLSQNARILYAAAKLFHRNFKWSIRVDNNLTHRRYQRDRLLVEYDVSRG